MAMNMDNTDTGSHEKTRDSLKVLHLAYKNGKHCVVTQSVYVMQPYPSL